MRDRPLGQVMVSLAILLLSTCTTPSGGPTPSSSSSASPLPKPFSVAERIPIKPLGLKQIVGFAVGPDGNAYVTDFPNQRVVVISPHGEVLDHWGNRGDGPGEFEFVGNPGANEDVFALIAVGDNGHVYVLDPGTSRVEAFTASGRFLTQMGGSGTREGQLWSPFGLAVNATGNVYVEDQIGLSMFSPAGVFISRVENRDLGGSIQMSGRVFDPHGRLVVTQGGTVVYLNDRGRPVDSFLVGGCDGGSVEVDPSGNTYVMSCDGDRLNVFDRFHELVAEWRDSAHPFAGVRIGANGEAFATIASGTVLLQLDLSIT
jgi:DNA-binding beta-propeller fold protein YncE